MKWIEDGKLETMERGGIFTSTTFIIWNGTIENTTDGRNDDKKEKILINFPIIGLVQGEWLCVITEWKKIG